MSTRTHRALVTVGPRKPFEVHQRPTKIPDGDEILVHSKFTASTPLDLHRADGGLLVEPPQVLGAVTVGIVQEVGPDAKRYRPGDEVFGWAHEGNYQAAHQEFVTAPEWKFGKIPNGFSMEQVATIPENFISAFNTLVSDLDLPTPWPKPADYVPPRASDPILIWGAASSVGQLSIQILKYYGYRHLIGTASPAHHEFLRHLGLSEVFDYKDPKVAEQLLEAASKAGIENKPRIPMVIDCIGSQEGSLKTIARLAEKGTIVAIMLPVILKHSSNDQAPEYSMEVADAAPWAEGVEPRGVRTHFVWRHAFFKENLATKIMPAFLAEGIVAPHRYRLIEGNNILERGTNALNTLRDGVSREKLVWRTSDN
ncbi:chaperonin 10-like protein [Truncatella angustata]|uniref:Chaperonin 10-like protein n=1 Tax=Truncatella angustata TaxID=152316 RepID=A0A9P8UTH5_9PEZI|nr:chaperonin 10-like protein [Truncatella angustata]KAH6658064.1 chaperonin 10-like protein [Truncatella angustata]